MSGSFAALTDIGRVRGENQDRALAITLVGGAVLLLAADGVGGAPGGALASEETARVVAEVFEEFAGAAPYPSLLLTAVNLANERVRLLQGQTAGLENMATTLIAAVIEGSRATIANLGDSRAYHLHTRDLRQVTEDDSWVATEVREGRLSEADAETHPWRNVITNGIGIGDTVDPALVSLSLDAGDALLLCTDGLFKMLAPDAIHAILATATDAGDAARALVEAANTRGGVDNIGVALWMS